MSYPVWPSALPRPERNTWSAVPQDARQKRRSEAGPPGYRRRFSSASTSVSLSIVVDRNGNAIFENFFKQTVSLGAGLFWMPDPTTDGWPLYASDGRPLLISGGPNDGKPILLSRQWLVTFGDQLPNETIIGVEFRRSFTVEVMP